MKMTAGKGDYPNLDREKMFKELWWLEYCCCTGVGIGAVGAPLCASEQRQLCVHSASECTDIGDPFCESIGVECCITSQCAFPKKEGSPTCACCNKVLAGAGQDNWKPKLFDLEVKWTDQFWLYYFLCAGVSVHAPCGNNKPLFGAVSKELCIRGQAQFVNPFQSGEHGMVLCTGLGTQLCCWSQQQFPPPPADKTATPCIACCGIKWKNKDKTEGKPGPMSYASGEAKV